jgi:hypothetical protein
MGISPLEATEKIEQYIMEPDLIFSIPDDPRRDFKEGSDLDIDMTFFPHLSSKCGLKFLSEMNDSAGHTPFSPCRLEFSAYEQCFAVRTNDHSAYGGQWVFRIFASQDESMLAGGRLEKGKESLERRRDEISGRLIGEG